jgi:hypothetical protein
MPHPISKRTTPDHRSQRQARRLEDFNRTLQRAFSPRAVGSAGTHTQKCSKPLG